MAKKKKVSDELDPLEAAKLTKADGPEDTPPPAVDPVLAALDAAEGTPAGDSGEANAEEAQAALEAAAAAEKAAKEEAAKVKPKPPKAAEIKAASPPMVRRKFEVMRKITISMGGQMVTLHPGKVVSSSTYDIDRLRQQGVKLRELKQS